MPIQTTFDASALERLKTSVSGDVSFLATLISDYIDDTAQHLETMQQAVEQRDVVLLERTAHSLKSTSETMGAVALAEASRKIETLARDGRFDEAVRYVPAATKQFATVRTQLRDQQAALQGP